MLENYAKTVACLFEYSSQDKAGVRWDHSNSPPGAGAAATTGQLPFSNFIILSFLDIYWLNQHIAILWNGKQYCNHRNSPPSAAAAANTGQLPYRSITIIIIIIIDISWSNL